MRARDELSVRVESRVQVGPEPGAQDKKRLAQFRVSQATTWVQAPSSSAIT